MQAIHIPVTYKKCANVLLTTPQKVIYIYIVYLNAHTHTFTRQHTIMSKLRLQAKASISSAVRFMTKWVEPNKPSSSAPHHANSTCERIYVYT